MAILPETIYRFNVILIKIPFSFPTEIDKISPKIHMETLKAPNNQDNPEQKDNNT
jgi:hypothetical protein